jgi:hypothetical protein
VSTPPQPRQPSIPTPSHPPQASHPHPLPAGLHDEKEQIADLEAELAKVQAEQAALPALLAEVEAALASEADAAEADAADLEAKEAAQQKTMDGVNGALEMYERRLGLSFVHQTASGVLDIIFTQVDPGAPERPFKVAIKVQDDDRYEGE